ncbi:MAG: ABC transporter permease [Caldilineaceae bacterium]|nr:ABC transporter permease [Caldilineaceae bacterium]
MIEYIIRRLLLAIPTLFLISVISFVVIQLPPGDFLTSYIAQIRAEEGDQAADAAIREGRIAVLQARYGLDQPLYMQYWRWISNIVLRGDFGWSFEQKTAVRDLIWERLGLTIVLTGLTIAFTWALAIPIGVLSAVKQYSLADYFFSFVGFVGLAIPNFLLALILMWLAFAYFDVNVTGLFSEQYMNAPWSLAKFVDMLQHMWLPVVILGTSGTAGLIRIMRANLLDELNKPYVEAARARGVSEWALIWRYPVRLALNPFVSTIGLILPTLISGATIISIVMSLPTTGPLFYRALLSQDMFLAGAFVLLLSVLTVIGMLISDILLVLLDPRIAYDGKE